MFLVLAGIGGVRIAEVIFRPVLNGHPYAADTFSIAYTPAYGDIPVSFSAGESTGDVLNLDVSGIPVAPLNTLPGLIVTTEPGAVIASDIVGATAIPLGGLTFSGVEDLNLTDGGVLIDVEIGDVFTRGTLGNDLIQHTSAANLADPTRTLLRLNTRFLYFSLTGKMVSYGNEGQDRISNSLPRPAHFYGEGGHDDLSGGDGDDLLVGGLGHDRVYGNAGADVLWGDNYYTVTGCAPTTPQDDLEGGNDQLYGGAGNDAIYGGGGGDYVVAGTGNDYVYGGQGDDGLSGDDGQDRLYGGAGSDVLNGQWGSDLLSGGAGNDNLIGDLGDDVLIGGGGADSLNGGGGVSGGADLLISGTAALETSRWRGGAHDVSLQTLVTNWVTSQSRVGLGSVTHDDGAVDGVSGGDGADDLAVSAADSDAYDFVPADGDELFVGDGAGTPAVEPNLAIGSGCVVLLPPVLAPVGDRIAPELSLLTFAVAATDPDTPSALLRYSMSGVNLPPQMQLDPITGVFSWTPSEAQGPGVYTVTFTVGDQGLPELTDSETITITVTEVNAAPELAPIGDQTVDEQALLSFTLAATDSDLPASSLTFSFVSGEQPGMALHPATGAFTWTPTEFQGPGDFPVTVRVADNGNPSLTATRSFTIHVTEVNTAPVLAPIPDWVLSPGSPLQFTAVGTDADSPANTLSYSLAGAPAGLGMTIAPGSGAFEWLEAATATPGVYTVTVVVTDNGVPALSDSQLVQIEVLTPPTPWVTLFEQDNFHTQAEFSFLVPPNPTAIALQFADLAFDLTDLDSINDAFELALVDAFDRPLSPMIAHGRNAFFNLTEGLPAALGGRAVYDPQTQTVSVDISQLTPGTMATVAARLVNNDQDDATTVRFRLTAEQLPVSPVTNPSDHVPLGYLPSLTSAVLDGLTDITSSVRLDYQRTAYNPDTRTLLAGVTLQNVGSFSVAGPLLLGVRAIDKPIVSLKAPLFVDPAGTAYYDLTPALSAGLDGLLSPGELLSGVDLLFSNRPELRFGYDVIVLGDLNERPHFTTTAVTQVRAGNTYRYDADARDPDDDPLTYSLVSGPAGLTVNPQTGLVSWPTTAGDVGNHRITLRVTDPAGAADVQSAALRVFEGAPNTPPRFTTSPVVDAFVGSDYLYPSAAFDVDGDNLTFSLVSGPPGLTVNASGLVSWPSPAPSLIGQHVPVTIQVADGHGGEDEQTYDILVHADPLNRRPVIVTAPQATFRMPTAAYTSTGDVNPQRIELDLEPGETVDVPIQITLPASPPGSSAVDLVFAIDDSGSMGQVHDWLTDVITAVDARFAQLGLTARYGLSAFGGGAGGTGPRVIPLGTEQDHWGDAADAIAGLVHFSFDGGTEDGWWAVNSALDEYDFSPQASRHIVLITDDYRDDGGGPPMTFESTQDRLLQEGVQLDVIGAGWFQADPLPSQVWRSDLGTFTSTDWREMTFSASDETSIVTTSAIVRHTGTLESEFFAFSASSNWTVHSDSLAAGADLLYLFDYHSADDYSFAGVIDTQYVIGSVSQGAMTVFAQSVMDSTELIDATATLQCALVDGSVIVDFSVGTYSLSYDILAAGDFSHRFGFFAAGNENGSPLAISDLLSLT